MGALISVPCCCVVAHSLHTKWLEIVINFWNTHIVLSKGSVQQQLEFAADGGIYRLPFFVAAKTRTFSLLNIYVCVKNMRWHLSSAAISFSFCSCTLPACVAFGSRDMQRRSRGRVEQGLPRELSWPVIPLFSVLLYQEENLAHNVISFTWSKAIRELPSEFLTVNKVLRSREKYLLGWNSMPHVTQVILEDIMFLLGLKIYETSFQNAPTITALCFVPLPDRKFNCTLKLRLIFVLQNKNK